MQWRLPDRRSRFAALVAGIAIASVVWIAIITAVATTPDQAREERATPTLPVPVVALKRQVLHQVTWYDCSRATETTILRAPAVPPDRRAVVTWLARPGSRARTGTFVVGVAGQPQVAVETAGVLYRDLAEGASGPDVEALTGAMAGAGWIDRRTRSLGAGALAAWYAHTGLAPADAIRWRDIVTVPRGARVGAAEVAVGDPVTRGQPLLTVTARARAFSCQVPDPVMSTEAADVRFVVSGREDGVAALVVHARDEESSGSIDVTPARDVRGDTARLGIEATGTRTPVLTAPLAAVKVGADGDPAVVVVTDGTAREVPVELGESAQGWIEVDGAGLGVETSVRLFDAGASGDAADGSD